MFEQLRFSNFPGIFLDCPFPLSWSLEQATFLLNTSLKSFPHALIDMTRLIFKFSSEFLCKSTCLTKMEPLLKAFF